jgi:hypothetical protein
MSSQTTRTTHSSACRHNMSCDGVYSWMPMLSNSITSKVTTTRLLIYLLMRGRELMLHLVMKTTLMVGHNIQAVTSSCQRVINDELLHIRPISNSEDTHYLYHPIFQETNDIDHQLYGSLDHFRSLALDHPLPCHFLVPNTKKSKPNIHYHHFLVFYFRNYFSSMDSSTKKVPNMAIFSSNI